MSKSKKLTDLTLEELIEKKKKAKAAVNGLGIVMIVAALIMLGLAIKSGNYAMISVILGCGVSFLPSLMGLNQIETEIKSRNKD